MKIIRRNTGVKYRVTCKACKSVLELTEEEYKSYAGSRFQCPVCNTWIGTYEYQTKVEVVRFFEDGES